jgi:hypothetical protein
MNGYRKKRSCGSDGCGSSKTSSPPDIRPVYRCAARTVTTSTQGRHQFDALPTAGTKPPLAVFRSDEILRSHNSKSGSDGILNSVKQYGTQLPSRLWVGHCNQRNKCQRSGSCTGAEQRCEGVLIAPCEEDFQGDHDKCDCQSPRGQKQVKEQDVYDDWSEDDQCKRNRNSG